MVMKTCHRLDYYPELKIPRDFGNTLEILAGRYDFAVRGIASDQLPGERAAVL